MELIDTIVKHLKYIICDGDEDLYDYVLKYFKFILLGHKVGTSLVVVGEQGTGKSLMFEYFGRRILGSDYFHLFQSLEQVTSRFSSCRCYKSCLVCDELTTWAGDHKTAQALKTLVTQTLTSLEYKCIDAKQVDDFANYIFLSNNRRPIKVEGKNDRRYCLVEVSNKKRQHFEYFQQLAEDMGMNTAKTDSDGFRLSEAQVFTEEQLERADVIGQHFFHFIMSQDIVGFNPGKIPKTALRVEAETESCPHLARFVRWFVARYVEQLLKRNGVDSQLIGKFMKHKDDGKSIPPLTEQLKITSGNLLRAYRAFSHSFGLCIKHKSFATLSKAIRKEHKALVNHFKRTNQTTYFQAAEFVALRTYVAGLEDSHRFEKELDEYKQDLTSITMPTHMVFPEDDS